MSAEEPDTSARPRTDARADDWPTEQVTSGVLASASSAEAEQASRRRALVGSAVLGLVTVGAILATMTVLQQRANSNAVDASTRAAARADLAEDIVLAAEAFEAPTVTVDADAETLRAVMVEHLVASDRSDAVLGSTANAAIRRLGTSADAVSELTERPVPQPGDGVDPDAALLALRELETLRAEARAMVEEIGVATAEAEAWLAAVQEVGAALTAHVDQVESEEATSNPDELIELWEAERPGLQRLQAAAVRSGRVEGLALWARAHKDYATGVLDWIDEAVALLEEDELDEYNERFTEEFGGDDPFGFAAAGTSAAQSAQQSPVLGVLDTLRTRAQIVIEAIIRTETTVADVLGEDRPKTGSPS